MANSKRLDKINNELQRAISEIINGKLKDPRLSGLISVLRTETTPDLKHAKVFVSIFNKDKEKSKESFAVLLSSAGFIRAEVARIMTTHTTPQLSFVFDESFEHSQRISQIIEGLHIGEDNSEE